MYKNFNIKKYVALNINVKTTAIVESIILNIQKINQKSLFL